MAVIAGHAGHFMRTHIPVRKCPCFGMTLQALGRLFRAVYFFIAKDKDINPAAAAFFNVGLTVTVT